MWISDIPSCDLMQWCNPSNRSLNMGAEAVAGESESWVNGKCLIWFICCFVVYLRYYPLCCVHSSKLTIEWHFAIDNADAGNLETDSEKNEEIVKNEWELYSCSTCDLHFDTEAVFKHNINSHFSEFNCSFCKKNFQVEIRLWSTYKDQSC